MPTGAQWALQSAIHQYLVGDAALVARLGGPRIHDDVPHGSAFPYVTIGESSAIDNGSFTGDGLAHTLTLHVWSRAGGRKEVKEIAALLRDALHERALTLMGHTLVNLRVGFTDARRDPDGLSYHGIVRLRAVTEPAL